MGMADPTYNLSITTPWVVASLILYVIALLATLIVTVPVLQHANSPQPSAALRLCPRGNKLDCRDPQPRRRSRAHGLETVTPNPAPWSQHERHSMSDVQRQPPATSMESSNSWNAELLLGARRVGPARPGLVFDYPGRACRIERAAFVHPISNLGGIRPAHWSRATK